MSDLYELPEGWAYASIEAICEVGRPISYGVLQPGSEQPDGIPLVRVCDINDGTVAFDQLKKISPEISKRFPRTVLRGGEVLLTVVGTIGRTAVALGVLKGANTARAVAVLPISPPIEPKFIELSLRDSRMRNRLTLAAHEVARKTLNLEDVRAAKIPIAPLKEQLRIVAKIEELFSDLDAGVAALKRAKANLKRYRAAILKAAVEGKLTEDWRAKNPPKESASTLLSRILKERRLKWEADQLAKFAAANKEPPKNWREKYVEPSPPVTTGLPELPDSWCWVTLGQLIHGIEGGKSFECLTRRAEPSEWGVVKVSAMTWGTFLEDEQKAIPPEAAFDPADEIKPNDLLLSRSNTTQLVGATVLVGNCRPRLLLSDKSLRLRAIEIVNLHWLHTVLSSSVARSQLSAMATGTSDSMRNVSQDKIKSVVFPLPPLAEQQWIVEGTSERLSQIDAAETAIEHDLLRAARLRQSILKQAFEGKLVPQDPNDEPASVLLERLRACRSVHEGNGKKVIQTTVRRRKSKKVIGMSAE